MTSADAMRASDADRERVVQALQEQVGEGRLTLAEFEQRTNTAYEAKTIGELRELVRDLPVNLFAPSRPQWQQAFPLPANSPWVQRDVPRSRLPIRRVHPLALVGLVLITLFIVQAIIGALAVGAEIAAPILPFLVLGFVLLRIAGRRRYRR